ncbi:receptor-like protein EIX1 [Musa acuminata AAA Group]|uniref:receptor-like protein EIX1 n=1 Tax=Musa acuminata AAA Group TaxID=214697 RepID=UPI0031D9D488
MGIIPSAAAAGDSSARCKENERAALLKLKQGLFDSSGRLSSWAGDDCCRWRGVRCSNRTGHVVQLRLRNPSPSPDGDDNFLSGKISPSLLELRHLSYLDLSRNRFDGASIPRFSGSLTSLRYLNLSDATFGRTIPHQLGNLSRLQYPDFHWLYIPPRPLVVDNFHWISRRSSLSYLDTSAINLSAAGDVYDEVTKLPRLSVLRLINCQLLRLPNTLPPSANLTSLTTLDLSSNYLGPLLPSWLSNISKSQEYRSLLQPVPWPDLWLWEVVFPSDISNFDKQLSGCVRNSLQVLNLANNALGGGVPVWIGELRNLKSLHLEDNLLSGLIPPSLGTLSSLSFLYLSDNMLRGSISESFGQLSELIVWVVSYNQLSGIVSDVHFSSITSFSSSWLPQFQLKNIHLGSGVLGVVEKRMEDIN